jgi:hypothetical protein
VRDGLGHLELLAAEMKGRQIARERAAFAEDRRQRSIVGGRRGRRGVVERSGRGFVVDQRRRRGDQRTLV